MSFYLIYLPHLLPNVVSQSCSIHLSSSTHIHIHILRIHNINLNFIKYTNLKHIELYTIINLKCIKTRGGYELKYSSTE